MGNDPDKDAKTQLVHELVDQLVEALMPLEQYERRRVLGAVFEVFGIPKPKE